VSDPGKNPGVCAMHYCKKQVEERCSAGDTCRDCHVSISFEDCNDRVDYVAATYRSGTETKEDLLKHYPRACKKLGIADA